jgi:hypothetical protein
VLSYFQIHSVFFLGLDNLIVFSYLDFVSEIIIDTRQYGVPCMMKRTHRRERVRH